MVLLSFPTTMLLPSLPATIVFGYFLTTILFFSVWLQLFLGACAGAIRGVFLPAEGVVFPVCCRAMVMDLVFLTLCQQIVIAWMISIVQGDRLAHNRVCGAADVPIR